MDGEPAASELGHYSAIFWTCGNEVTNTLTANEQNALSTYLNNGGKLFITGQGIRNDLSSSTFFADYLHSATDGNLAGDRVVRGVAGNAIYGTANLLLQGGGNCGNNGTLGPDRITPINGGQAAFEYGGAGGMAGVMYDGTYKVIYLAFALEAACGLANTDHYSVVLTSTLNWWQISDADHDAGAVLPTSTRLLGNYPNPFNPTTELQFELGSVSQVELTIYDVQGRLVSELVNDVVQPGVHVVRFDATTLASGVYFARLTTPGFAQSAKMVLLK